MESLETKSTIRIYVACLAAYNHGEMHGRWIDATQGKKHIEEQVQMTLKASPIEEEAEEWAIHDYEGFGDIYLSESTSFERVAEIAGFIEEQEELGAKLYAHFGNMDDAKRAFEDSYIGEFESVAEYAEELTTETTPIPGSLHFYIDYEKMAADMKINDLFAIEDEKGRVHLFWNI